jgi:hypothetical protein
VNVSAKSYVVGEIPAVVVGIFVNHHIVAVPIPVIGVGKVKRGDAEVEAAKPETAGIPTLDAPPMSMAEATLKAAVLPRVVQVKAVVIPPHVVPNPFAVVVDVWSFRMAVAVRIRVPVSIVIVVIVAVAFVLVAMIGLRPVVRNVSSADVVVVVVFLGEGWQGEDQSRCKDSGKQFH